MLDWWLASLSGAASHQIEGALAWHGRVMVIAWSVLAPVALLWARYWKIAPQQDFPRVLDDKRWWHAHRGLQTLAALLTLIAIALALNSPTSAATTAGPWRVSQIHGWLGWAVVAALMAQLIHGLMRGSKGGPTDAQMRGDHYDMTPRRLAFERVHKSLGWLTLLAAWLATLLGLWAADAPRWMLVMITLWWSVLLAALLRWQRAGRCVDTYQAIWGLGADLPGMSIAPIGWGVRRYTTTQQGVEVAADAALPAKNRGIR